ncbi:FAD dependent oxidoreductase [compost metagenome]
MDYVRANLPGFENCYMLDVASQMGVRQTRLLQGEYVMTKDDVTQRRHFADTVARGRDYYYPYRSLLPKEVDQLLVAGRHYSATPEAQKMSREIPPCMAMGQAVGVAAALAVENGLLVRDVSALDIQQGMRRHGADPGDVPSSNATVDADAAVPA